ncbi:MAG: flagellar motor switch protein FliG, partial [Firmicutes bacterium HGW-Firmicutes-13]
MKKKLNGTEKAAVLLLSMGPAMSSKILKHFNEGEIERISMEIANTAKVDSATLEEVLDEFIVMTEAQKYILDGGFQYARELLEKTVGHHKASEIIKRLK